MKIKLCEQNTFCDSKNENKLKTQYEIARNLLNIIDDEIIAQTTGLSFEQVQKIRNEPIATES